MKTKRVIRDIGLPTLATLLLVMSILTLYQTNQEYHRIDLSTESASEVGDNFTVLSSRIHLDSTEVYDWISANQYRFETAVSRETNSRLNSVAIRPGQGNFSISIFDEGNYSVPLRLHPKTVSIDYWSTSRCYEIRTVESDIDWKVNQDGLYESKWSTASPNDVHQLSFSVMAGGYSIPADLTIMSMSGDSYVTIICDSPEINVDGNPIFASGKTFLSINRFGVVEARLYYDSEATVNISIPFSLSFHSARSIVPLHNSSLSWGGVSREFSGQLDIADSSDMALSFSRLPWEYFTPSLSLEAEDAIVYEGDSRIGTESHYIHSEMTRTMGTVLAFAVFAVVVAVWTRRVPPLWHREENEDASNDISAEENKRKEDVKPRRRRPRIGTFVWSISVIILISLGVLSAISPVLDKPPAYFYAHYPTQLDIYIEDGVNESHITPVVTMFVEELNGLLGFRLSGEPRYHHMDDDGTYTYYRGEDEIWKPVGEKELSRLGITFSGKGNLYLIFHSGVGWDREDASLFAGLAQMGDPVSAYPIYGLPSSLDLLQTMIHEFGHSIGLEHNQCGYVMAVPNGEPRRPTHQYSVDTDSQESAIFVDSLRKGEIPSVPQWGEPLLYSLNSSSPTADTNFSRVVSNILYSNSRTKTYHELWYRHTKNQTSEEIEEWLTVRSLNWQGFQHGWSGEESLYISKARTSHPIPIPEVPPGCRSP
jgi:hypothetical protein